MLPAYALVGAAHPVYFPESNVCGTDEAVRFIFPFVPLLCAARKIISLMLSQFPVFPCYVVVISL